MEPFTFRWGPGRLVGLGVNLEPDQAAVTETPGVALGITPIWDPIQYSDAWGSKCKRIRHDGSYLYRPVLLETTLNQDMGHLYHGQPEDLSLQDLIDENSMMGEEWRRYAAAAACHSLGPIQIMDVMADEGAYYPQSAWDIIMISPEQAERLAPQIYAIWNATPYEMLEVFVDRATEREYGSEEYDPDLEEPYGVMCARLGVEPAEPGEMQDFPDTVSLPGAVPEWNFEDADLDRIWQRLVRKSQRDWDALRSAQSKQSLFDRTYRKAQPWF